MEVDQKLSGHELQAMKVLPLANSPKYVWQSKFGGDPYWPLNVDNYPVDKKGRPFSLLAQFNLAELPSLVDFPAEGMLQFFISSHSWGGGYLPKGKSLEVYVKESVGYKVVYHKEVIKDKKLLKSNFDDDRRRMPINGEYALEFVIERELASPSDYRFDEIIGSSYSDKYYDDTIDYLFEKYDSSGSKIGGYAYFTQEDPRRYDGTYENWLLLFQMDSSDDKEVDIMWGDLGVCNFFIRPDDLKNLDFSKVWYNWDCH